MRLEEENVGYGSQYDTSVGVAFLFLTIGGTHVRKDDKVIQEIRKHFR